MSRKSPVYAVGVLLVPLLGAMLVGQFYGTPAGPSYVETDSIESTLDGVTEFLFRSDTGLPRYGTGSEGSTPPAVRGHQVASPSTAKRVGRRSSPVVTPEDDRPLKSSPDLNDSARPGGSLIQIIVTNYR